MATKKTAKKSIKKSVKKSTAKKVAKKVSAQEIIKGFKTVGMDMCSWYDSTYEFTVGKEHTVQLSADDRNGEPCGRGLHFGRTWDDAVSYADDDDYIMLEVQANKSDILGQDTNKIRVSKLKVVKVLEKHERHGAEWKKAVKEAEDICKNFLKPNKAATTQKITAAVNAYTKAQGLKGVKVHIVDNIYEADHAVQSLDPAQQFNYYYDDDANLGVNLQHLPLNDEGVWEAAVLDILNQYIDSRAPFTGHDKSVTPLVNLLKLGCFPIGLTHDKKNFVVFQSKTEPKKLHNLY